MNEVLLELGIRSRTLSLPLRRRRVRVCRPKRHLGETLASFVVGLTLGTYLGEMFARPLGIATTTVACLVAFAGMQ